MDTRTVVKLNVDQVSAIERVFLDNLSKFEKHGYQYDGTELSKDGSTLLIKFRNPSSGMSIRLTFFAATGGRNGGFTAFIVRRDQASLDVAQFLRNRNLRSALQHFFYRDESTDVSTFASAFVQTLDDLLENELKDVVEGRRWENVPVDWMGLK